jgi:ADP-L-glycero-D-manno-heptose 6-epimerase
MAKSQLIAVTGAAGFIGSQVALALQEKHGADSLLLIDHPLTPDKNANMVPLKSALFLDHETFIRRLESAEIAPAVIIHLGACSDTTEQNWSYLLQNNLQYSQRIWTWCAKQSAQLVYASSAATYGDGNLGFDDEVDITQFKPLNLYGQSKQDFDCWVEKQVNLGAKKPPQCVGLKFFNVFGPGEAHKGRMASMVFHGYNQIQSKGRVRLFKSSRPDYADGGQLRDFIYVNDVVAVIDRLIGQPAVSGLFNLGTGRARTFRDLIEAVFAALERPPNIEYIPMPLDLEGKYQYFTEAKMDKLAKAIGPYRFQSLEESVRDYVTSHLAAQQSNQQ